MRLPEAVAVINRALHAPHIVHLDDGHWVLRHPLTCRPGLEGCEVTKACLALDGPLGLAPGCYEVILDDTGAAVIGAPSRDDEGDLPAAIRLVVAELEATRG